MQTIASIGPGQVLTEQGGVLHRVPDAVRGLVECAAWIELRIVQVRIDLCLGRILTHTFRSAANRLAAQFELQIRIIGTGVGGHCERLAHVQ